MTIRRSRWVRLLRLGWAPLCLLLVAACHQDMYEQQRYQYQEPSSFFADNRSARPLPAGSVQYLDDRGDTHFYTGRVVGELVTEFPFPIDAAILNEGQRTYNDFCAPCHGLTGAGNGYIAYRGDFQVPSFHDQRLRDAPVGYYFDVISNGIGRMYGYSTRIEEAERWAVIAYVRALQLSRNGTPEDVPAEERSRLGGG